MCSEWDKTHLEMYDVCLLQVVAHVKGSVMKLYMSYSQFQNVPYTVVYVTQRRMHVTGNAGTPLVSEPSN